MYPYHKTSSKMYVCAHKNTRTQRHLLIRIKERSMHSIFKNQGKRTTLLTQCLLTRTHTHTTYIILVGRWGGEGKIIGCQSNIFSGEKKNQWELTRQRYVKQQQRQLQATQPQYHQPSLPPLSCRQHKSLERQSDL